MQQSHSSDANTVVTQAVKQYPAFYEHEGSLLYYCVHMNLPLAPIL